MGEGELARFRVGPAPGQRRGRGAVVRGRGRGAWKRGRCREAGGRRRSRSASPRVTPPGRAAGRRPGRRLASIVFPAPGGPDIRRLCAPAAASSRARRGRACPRTSARSTSGGSGFSAGGPRPGGTSGSVSRPARWAIAAPRCGTARTMTSAGGGRLGGVLRRDEELGAAVPPRRFGDREDAGHRPDGAVEGELADEGDAGEGLRGNVAVCREDREGAREVERRPGLREVRRREVDDDAPPGERVPDVPEGRADPLPALLHGGVGKADDREVRQARADRGLDDDRLTFESDHGGGVGAGDRHLGLRQAR